MELIKLKAKVAKFNSNKVGTRVAQNKNPKNKNDPKLKFTKKQRITEITMKINTRNHITRRGNGKNFPK